ncbi:MAG: sugar porter family MFS transporter [Ancrocorticia sp.]
MSSSPAPQKTGVNGLVIRSAIVASLGGLIFGFDTAVISGAISSLEKVFGLTAFDTGFVVAIATVGTVLGAIIAGRLAEQYGRHKILFAIGVLYILASLGTALAINLPMLDVFRFIGGIGVGMSSVVAPIYTAEISPAAIRGRLVGLVQFNIVFGILLAYLSNFIINQIMGDNLDKWRWMLGVMAVPSILFFILLFTTPETPRWLISHGREQQGVATSRKLCSTQAESDQQLAEIRGQIEEDRKLSGTKVSLFAPRYRKVVMMAFLIAAFNQLSGINAILYYAPKVFENAGASESLATLLPVFVGLMNLVATMTALTVIDKLGRRTLMLVGSIGYLISLGFIAAVMFYYENAKGGAFDGTSVTLVFVGLLVFIAAHAFGQGSVIWVFISEIFPQEVRASGQSFGSMTHWIFAAITTYAFPPVISFLGGGVAFLLFFVFMVGQLFWVLRVMPETKGVPLEKMAAKLGLDKA